MASVKKSTVSQFWYACYRLPTGKRRQVSTGLTDKHQALKVALSLEHAGMQASAGKLTHRRVFTLVQKICGAGEPRAPTRKNATKPAEIIPFPAKIPQT